MKRQEKFPDTEYFHFFNANPYKKIRTNDCAVRAISLATNQSWKETFTDLCTLALKYGIMPSDKACVEKYLESKGWIKCRQPKKGNYGNLTKYTGKEFCKALSCINVEYFLPISKDSAKGPIIASIGTHHLTCIKDCKVWDTWDCTDDYIGNYWKPLE